MRHLSLPSSRLWDAALILGLLWLCRPVVVPLVLSFYLAFVLKPACNGLERLGMPRVLSTVTVMGAALAVVVGLGSMLFAQALDLATQLTTYSAQMSEKLSSMREGRLQVLNELSDAFAELSRRIDPETAAELSTPVRVVSGGGSALSRLEEAVGPVLTPAAVALVVLVMTSFIVARREDLRGRLIQLLGPEHATVTTRTLGDAMTRVGHLLLTQVYINASFGAVIGVGLYVIGVPFALLWGALAAVLRFVPFLGAWIAGALPTLVAFAVFPGWREALLTGGFFLVTDVLLGNFVEPLVLGKRTGVSALALLVSALFFTWLWGPIGLVLATPITVCAAVVGRHVPSLAFLSTALGDEPGLNAEIEFYQRTLSRSTKDALLFAKRHVAETSLTRTYDELLVPSLALLSNDLAARVVNDPTAERAARDIGEIALRLEGSTRVSLPSGQGAVMGVAAEPLLDAPLLQMLRASLAKEQLLLGVIDARDRNEALAQLVAQRPPLVCIAALPPYGNASARFLCRRLRVQLPDTFVLALVPETVEKHWREAAARLREAGASLVTHSVGEAARVLAERAAPRASGSAGRASLAALAEAAAISYRSRS